MNLGINYNLLNLPHEITEQSTVKATYTYLADGTKAGAVDDNGVGFEYLGSMVYNNNNGTKTLESAAFGGGRINKTNNNDYDITYFITDHLGSTRVIVDNAGNIKEQNDYYPFGMRHENSLLMVSSNRWGYNGKEKQIVGGINYLDYLNRLLDGERWTTQDPLQEERPWESAYSFCGNNPINRLDMKGLIWDDIQQAVDLKVKIDTKITTLENTMKSNQESIDAGGLSDKKVASLRKENAELQQRITNLGTVKTDIDRLGADQNNVYRLSLSSDNGKHTVYKGGDGKVYIQGTTDAIHIHEITHVRQSLDAGGLRFDPLDNSLQYTDKFLNTKVNAEIGAYQMQYSYDKSFPGSLGNKGLQGIDVHSIGNIYDSDAGDYVYRDIHFYSEKLKKNREKQIKKVKQYTN